MSTIFSTVHAHAKQTARPVRVLVVDDHQLFRIGLRRLLEEEGFAVIDAGSAETGLRRSADRLPDVVVLGINHPAASRCDEISRVLEAAPQAGVLVLALVRDEGHVVEAVRAGAVGYLLKDAELERIVAGIGDVAAGRSPLSPAVGRILIDRVRHSHEPDSGSLASELSERERAVLSLLASGCDNAQIGDRLYVSRSTVKNHVASVLEKLHVDNRVQAATYAVRAGLV